jgi:hypothetical protein
MGCSNMAQNVEAAAIGHVDVEDEQIPFSRPQAIERFVACSGLADFGDATVLHEKTSQASPNHWVIIRN